MFFASNKSGPVILYEPGPIEYLSDSNSFGQFISLRFYIAEIYFRKGIS